MAQGGAQEIRSDLEMPVRLERGFAGRPHVMQHENSANAGQKWAQQMVRPAEIECFQPGANDVATQLFHDRLAAPWAFRPQLRVTPLKKKLFQLPGKAFGRAPFPV